MGMESWDTPDSPPDPPHSVDGSSAPDSPQKPERKTQPNQMRELEKVPRWRALVAYIAGHGGTVRDIRDMLQQESGSAPQESEIEYCITHAGGLKKYARYLQKMRLREVDVRVAQTIGRPLLVERRGALLWRHDPRAAAFGFHFIRLGCTEREFAQAMRILLQTPASIENIRMRYNTSLAEAIEQGTTLEKILLRTAGATLILETAADAKALFKSVHRERLGSIHRKAPWMQQPPVITRFIELLQQEAGNGRKAAGNIMEGLRVKFPPEIFSLLGIKRETVYDILRRYRSNPTATLAQLKQGLEGD